MGSGRKKWGMDYTCDLMGREILVGSFVKNVLLKSLGHREGKSGRVGSPSYTHMVALPPVSFSIL